MLPLNVSEIVRAVRGSLVIGDPAITLTPPHTTDFPTQTSHVPWPPSGISIDSRTAQKGDFFFALKGENFDGHHFLNEAIRKGVSLCFISEIPQSLNVQLYDFPTIIKVSDTRNALKLLAKLYREKFGSKICRVSVSGSCGKTTVKEMIAQILRSGYPTAFSPGNYNNEIGCPLSIFYMSPEQTYGVFEIGSSKKGEVQELSALVEPRVTVVTNIRLEHSETFGDLKEIAQGESESLPFLPEEGCAALPHDDSFFNFLRSRVPPKCHVKSFGFSNQSSVYPTDISLHANKTRFTVTHQDTPGKVREQFECEIPVLGKFNVLNALAAIAACLFLKIPIGRIQEGLKHFRSLPLRFQMIEFNGGGLIVNDSYNANPGSVRSSLESFAESFPNRQKCVVMGDMLELGAFSQKEHLEIGKLLQNLPLSNVILFGNETKTIYDYLRSQPVQNQTAVYTKDRKELLKIVQPLANQDHVILFKASRSMRLEEIVEKIVKNSS
ncbi:MAG: UDP-N-acetylmuramoyl-tripeptide--D-alanyl-D-alanine ligase [Elusimicrobia bacterium]|nr:UDP-N-acetylmuramoyl-tripeptide--D-alanyl-D-alanine ligase [Elusimicrobiota bacterium]